jgi:hypothetical protein
MAQESAPSPSVVPTGSSTWQKLAGWSTRQLRRVPPLLLIAVAVALAIAIFFLAMHTASPEGTANLKIRVQHGLRAAQLSIWVDDNLAYHGRISGAARKRFGLIPGAVQGSFSRTLRVTAGKHAVKMQVSAPSEGYEEVRTIEGQFPPNGDVALIASVHSHDVELAWQGISATSVDGGPAWYLKYGSSLLMTVAGSIVSAITAFLIRELPNLARRGDTVSKA